MRFGRRVELGDRQPRRAVNAFDGTSVYDILRYRVGTPTSYSFATRIGRGLTDNAPEVCFRWSRITRCPTA
ncbi:MAG: hypothetical protein JO057_03245 [Chloroflexi bacterium]|nr:hypothetical protein [Chloroflexota bacterium]